MRDVPTIGIRSAAAPARSFRDQTHRRGFYPVKRRLVEPDVHLPNVSLNQRIVRSIESNLGAEVGVIGVLSKKIERLRCHDFALISQHIETGILRHDAPLGISRTTIVWQLGYSNPNLGTSFKLDLTAEKDRGVFIIAHERVDRIHCAAVHGDVHLSFQKLAVALAKVLPELSPDRDRAR